MTYGYPGAAFSQAREDHRLFSRSSGRADVGNIASVVTIVTSILAVLIALAGLRFWRGCVRRKATLMVRAALFLLTTCSCRLWWFI